VSQSARDRLKILAWDRSGVWVRYKRLEQGTFAWPTPSDGPVEMASGDLALLLAGVDLAHTRRRRWYERVVEGRVERRWRADGHV
jgi:transposase